MQKFRFSQKRFNFTIRQRLRRICVNLDTFSDYLIAPEVNFVPNFFTFTTRMMQEYMINLHHIMKDYNPHYQNIWLEYWHHDDFSLEILEDLNEILDYHDLAH